MQFRAGQRGRFAAWCGVLGVVSAAALSVLTTAGCEAGGPGAQGQGAAAPPPSVVVAPVEQRTVPVMADLVARLAADETVEVRARVEALLVSDHFQDGAMVRKGQLLFKLDDRVYAAQVQSARAQLARATADLEFAKGNNIVEVSEAQLAQAKARQGKARQDVARLRPLAAENAVPQQDLDTATAALEVADADVQSSEAMLETSTLNRQVTVEQAEAAVLSAQASLTQAELNLSYCQVFAPISGRIAYGESDVGNLVGRGSPTILATITSVDPVKVSFAVPEADYLQLARRYLAEGGLQGDSFELVLSDNSVHPHKGRVVTVGSTVDQTTGTLSLQAEFPNPNGLLRPGQFGRVRVPIRTVENALLIQQRAVQEQQSSRFVYVVGSDNKVALRTITVGPRVESMFVVNSGLEAGERVIVEGILKARPGMIVAPTEQPLTAEK